MSRFQKKTFTFAPLTAIMNLGPSESMVWTCMLTFQGNNKYAWPTLEAISKRLGGKLRPKRISQVIIQLEKKGWMKKIRRGYGKSNLYQCITPEDLLFQPNFGQEELPAIPEKKIEIAESLRTTEPKEEIEIDYNDPFVKWFIGETEVCPK